MLYCRCFQSVFTRTVVGLSILIILYRNARLSIRVLSKYNELVSITHSSAYIQRDGGLAKRRLTLNVLRATSVHVCTSLSAGLLPPLRQTARCVLASMYFAEPRNYQVDDFSLIKLIYENHNFYFVKRLLLVTPVNLL